MAISGIYAIVNKINGHRYIGSSADITGRWKNHRERLAKNNHHSRHLQHAWDCYGKDSFDFIVITECSVLELIAIEQKYIDEMAPEYNVSPIAGRTAGVIRTEEYKRKQSVSQSGKIISAETRQRISAGMKGKRNGAGFTRVKSEEERRKISIANTGRIISAEQRRATGEKNQLYRHTEEAKRKIGEASKGNKYAVRKHTPDEIARHSEMMREYWSQHKRVISEETKRKISESVRNYYAERRAANAGSTD